MHAEFSNAYWSKLLAKIIEVYPNRLNERAAARAWGHIRPRTKGVFDYIKRGATEYATLVEAEGTPPKYIKKLENWLKDEGWKEDYVKLIPKDSPTAKTGNYKGRDRDDESSL